MATFSKEELYRLISKVEICRLIMQFFVEASRQKVDMAMQKFARITRIDASRIGFYIFKGAQFWARNKLIDTTDDMKAILGFLQSISTKKKRVKMETRHN
jgi:hypothetical protein